MTITATSSRSHGAVAASLERPARDARRREAGHEEDDGLWDVVEAEEAPLADALAAVDRTNAGLVTKVGGHKVTLTLRARTPPTV